MAEVTVKQLAETVGAPTDRLLKQMNEAGLPHSGEDETVTEEQKQTLLAFLKTSHGGAAEAAAPKKISLKRKTVSTLRTDRGRGKAVAVEVRKKRTYVKRAPAEETQAPPVVESELEKVKAQDAAAEQERQKAEAERRAEEAERKAESERRAEEAEREKAEAAERAKNEEDEKKQREEAEAAA